jgi:hypothetical protein
LLIIGGMMGKNSYVHHVDTREKTDDTEDTDNDVK